MRWIVRLDTVVELVVVVAQHWGGGGGWTDGQIEWRRSAAWDREREREKVAAALGTSFYWLVGSTSA